MFSIVLGLIILVFTFYSWRKEEVDPLGWTDWGFFDVNKTDHPFIFGLVITIETLVGLGFITWGILQEFVFE